MLLTARGECVTVREIEVLSQHRARAGAELLDSVHVHVGGEPRRQRGEPPEPAQPPQLRLHLPDVFRPLDGEAARIAPTASALVQIRLLRSGERRERSTRAL